MKSKTSLSKKIIGHPNTNKEKVLGPSQNKEWIIGHPLH
jgi:hypothetical protein